MHIYNRRGLTVRFTYLAIAIVWWLITLGGRLSRARVVTLCYHGVTAAQRKKFAKQMALIHSRAVSCEQIFLKSKAIVGKPAVCITFDDAFANLIENALPYTTDFGIPVTIFAVTMNLGLPPRWNISSAHPDANEITMTSEQLKSVSQKSLCTIASHSATHPRMTELTNDVARHEFSQSRDTLVGLLGESVDDFAFPHSACNEKLIRIAFASGYRRVFTLSNTAKNLEQDQQVMSRMKMTPDVWRIEFLLTAAGAYSWIYALRQFRRWLLYRTSDSQIASVFEAQVPRT